MKNVRAEAFPGIVQLPSTEDFMRYLREAFGGLHLLMAGMDDAEKQATWEAVAAAVSPFEGAQGFQCPSEVIVCCGTR